MKGTKEYRWESNPKEKEFHDKFIEWCFNENPYLNPYILDHVIFGTGNSNGPKDYLTDKEKVICINLIQWLGSPVGQSFLDECGFKLDDNATKNKQ